MILGHGPPIKRAKYRGPDERLKRLVVGAVEAWNEQIPVAIEYLSSIAYNFRAGQGPYVRPVINDDEGALDEIDDSGDGAVNEKEAVEVAGDDKESREIIGAGEESGEDDVGLEIRSLYKLLTDIPAGKT